MVTKEQLKSIGRSPFDAVKLGLPLFKYKNGVTPYLVFDSKSKMFVSSIETAITKNHEIYSFIDDCWYDGNPTMKAVVMDDFLSSSFALRMELAVEKNKELLNCLNPILFAKFRIGVMLHVTGRLIIDQFTVYDISSLTRILQSLDNMLLSSDLSGEWWGLYSKTTNQLSEKYQFTPFNGRNFKNNDALEVVISPEKQKDLDKIQIIADTKHIYGEKGVDVLRTHRRYLLMSSFV